MRDVYVRKTYTVTENQTHKIHPIMGGSPSGPTASSATKELDDLMASLSDFKVKEIKIIMSYELILSC